MATQRRFHTFRNRIIYINNHSLCNYCSRNILPTPST